MIQNTVVHEATQQFQLSYGRISVLLFGRPSDWNLSGDEQEDVRARLGIVCRKLDLQTVYAPVPSKFNAEICDPSDLTEAIQLGEDVCLYRGCYADGVEIYPKRAFWLSSADCVTIVAHHPSGKVVVAHGGRDCLVDRQRIAGGPPRRHESVVHAIAERFYSKELKELRIFMTCGIGPEHFSHPRNHEVHGASNANMVRNIFSRHEPTVLYGDYSQGNISLLEVARCQFVELGVVPHYISYDGVDTYGDRNRCGEYCWWSNRRGDGKKRNGVLVVRNW